MNMNKILTSIALILALTTTNAYGDVSLQNGKSAVKRNLINPSSAKFRGVFHNRGADGLSIVCGEIQFKNGYGQQMGWQRFLSNGAAKGSYIEQEVYDFYNIWNRVCT